MATKVLSMFQLIVFHHHTSNFIHCIPHRFIHSRATIDELFYTNYHWVHSLGKFTKWWMCTITAYTSSTVFSFYSISLVILLYFKYSIVLISLAILRLYLIYYCGTSEYIVHLWSRKRSSTTICKLKTMITIFSVEFNYLLRKAPLYWSCILFFLWMVVLMAKATKRKLF